MDIQKIKQLIDVLAASDLAEIDLVEGQDRVRLIKRLRADDGALPKAAPDTPAAASHGAAEPDAGDSDRASQETSNADPSEWVTAPLYGVVHLTPAPDAASFVQLGDTVQPGQTVCVIEAMKMFHEVKVGRNARIQAILATAGDEVETGAALFQLAAVQ